MKRGIRKNKGALETLKRTCQCVLFPKAGTPSNWVCSCPDFVDIHPVN